MKTIIASFLTLIISLFINAQVLRPTENDALIEVSVKNHEGKPLPGEIIQFTSKKTARVWTVTTNNAGAASILLPKGDTYQISYKELLTDKDYAMLDIENEEGLVTFTVEIIYEPERVFRLDNVYFDFGKSSLRPESYPALDQLAELLRLQPTMVIEIAGHTDNIGSPQSNLQLSQARAEAVRQYLIKKGINPNRLIARGYGDMQPIAPNTTEEGRQLNRRTEVRILSK